MNQEHLIESIFDKVLEEKRNNTPVPTNEESETLSESIDIELSAIEDNKDAVDVPEATKIEPQTVPETKITEMEEMVREELVEEKDTEKDTEKVTEKVTEKDTEKVTEKDTEKVTEKVTEKTKSKYTIICESLSKLLCCK